MTHGQIAHLQTMDGHALSTQALHEAAARWHAEHDSEQPVRQPIYVAVVKNETKWRGWRIPIAIASRNKALLLELDTDYTLADLAHFGIYADLLARSLRHGYIARLSHGIYRRGETVE